jgi:hypothetical protein
MWALADLFAHNTVLDLLVIWMFLAAALVAFAIHRPREGGALTTSYFLGLSLIHVPGVLPFLTAVSFSQFSHGLADPEATRSGFAMTIIGMTAFVSGATGARIIYTLRIGSKNSRRGYPRLLAFERGRSAIVIGAVSYFFILPLARDISSLTSLVSPLVTLIIIGFWLMLYGAAESGDRWRSSIIFAFLPLLPLATLVTGGFLGYGINLVLSILAFQFVITDRRFWFYASAPVAIYLGLSLLVAYLGERNAIRELVWERQAGISDRIERINAMLTTFHLFNPTSPVDLAALDSRLNQNSFVGLAIEHIDTGWADFAYGGTVPAWGLVPRALWTEKPSIAGGPAIVENFTGVRFAEDTSVGLGQVMEFYVNFGTFGVLIGFLVLGFALMWLDRGIMRALATHDTRGVFVRAVPGLLLLQPGGNLLEILVGLVAGIILTQSLFSVTALRISSPTTPDHRAA